MQTARRTGEDRLGADAEPRGGDPHEARDRARRRRRDDAAARLRRRVLPRDRRTILKDNISWHLPFLSANTTPWQLEGVVRTLREDGFRDLLGLHNQTVVTDAHRGDELNKFAGVYRRYEVPTVDNFSPDCRWVTIEPKAPLLVLDRIFGEVRVPEVMIGSNIVHLPTVKTHVYTTMTGAMKNAFGGLLRENRHWAHTDIHATLVDLLADPEGDPPGDVRGHGRHDLRRRGGPAGHDPGGQGLHAGQRRHGGDRRGERLADGLRPAGRRRLHPASPTSGASGVGDVREIEVVGEDISEVNFHFQVRYHFASRVGRLLWFTPLARIQSLFFKTPLVHAFIWGSAVYHDRYWWPVHGRRRMAEIATTPWGRLFEAYE